MSMAFWIPPLHVVCLYCFLSPLSYKFQKKKKTIGPSDVGWDYNTIFFLWPESMVLAPIMAEGTRAQGQRRFEDIVKQLLDSSNK